MSLRTDSDLHEIRADVWLWAARFFKTRALAKQALGGGRVELDGAPCKAARPLRVGDKLRISRGEERIEVAVLALSGQRGPAPQAQALYRETESSQRTREAAREQRRLTGADLLRPPSRPGKHDRRALRQLKDPFRSDAG
ncbi:MAG: RNA-binding S4 domain-containing protein [Pseudomonadota bacterium]|nr:RNA-binding S4 domain-containing protein [Pseudomonadota bacterium]